MVLPFMLFLAPELFRPAMLLFLNRVERSVSCYRFPLMTRHDGFIEVGKTVPRDRSER